MEKQIYRLACGCIPDASGYGYCYECTKSLQTKIWQKMSEKEKRYDRHFAPDQSAQLDEWSGESTGCSCHINPPCSYCMQKGGEEGE